MEMTGRTFAMAEDDMGEPYEVYPGWPNFAKGVVHEFEDVKPEEKLDLFKNEWYGLIEKLIISWNNDGTKTAGVLARRICQLLNSRNGTL